MIKIDFEFETEYGTFRDAITLPDDHILSDSEIEAMKLDRLNKFISMISNPPMVEPEPEYIEIDGVKYLKAE